MTALVKKRLLEAVGALDVGDAGPDAGIKVFVDTAPLMEKPLAVRRGLGWQGRHTNLVSRALGSWLFLGGVYPDRWSSRPDGPEADHCGRVPAPASMPARPTLSRRPISWTRGAASPISPSSIPGPIAHARRPLMGNRIYGCDDCLSVCPWNKFAQATSRCTVSSPRTDLKAPRLADLARLDDAAFRALFSGSPIKRIGRDRFMPNVLAAIGNSDTAELCRVMDSFIYPDVAPIVRGASRSERSVSSMRGIFQPANSLPRTSGN